MAGIKGFIVRESTFYAYRLLSFCQPVLREVDSGFKSLADQKDHHEGRILHHIELDVGRAPRFG